MNGQVHEVIEDGRLVATFEETGDIDRYSSGEVIRGFRLLDPTVKVAHPEALVVMAHTPESASRLVRTLGWVRREVSA